MKEWKARFFLLVVLALLVAMLFALVGCEESASSVQPVATATGTPKIVQDIAATQTATALATATPAKVSATATTMPTATPTEEPALTVDYTPPANAIPLTAFGNTKGYFYALNEEGPYQVEYPYQSTLLITVGNAWIGEEATHITLTSDGTIGNIYTDVCTKENGCSVKISHYAAGHVGTTIIFGGMEVPSQTLADAVNNMFEPSNCGGSGCKTIYVYNTGEKSLEFTKEIEASAVSEVLVAPVKPYAKVTIGNNGAPAGAEVVLNETNDPVGQTYYLPDSGFVSVPEAGGTVIYCGAKATVDEKDCAVGTAIAFPGTASDGGTPEDLNQTIEIKSSDPNMIRVIMIYSGSFEDQISKLKENCPEWIWSK